MRMLSISSLLLNIAVASLVATSANPSVSYQYTGVFRVESDLYDTTMSITGFIELESPLAPNLTVKS